MNAKLIGVPVAMIALLAAGMATGTSVYYVFFAVLLLIMFFSVASVVWTLLTLKISIAGVRSRVVRGESLSLSIEVKNSSVLPVGMVTLITQVPGSTNGTRETNAMIAPMSRKQFRNPVRCPHRGDYRIGVTAVKVEDIFGLVRMKRNIKGRTARVTVIPGTVDVETLELRATDMGPEFMSRASEDNAEPADVRTWQDGDELKKVHWKLSLRKRELMVRTFEESARPDTLVIPDVSEISALRDRKLTLEDCICEAALSHAKTQLNAGYPVLMPLQSKQPMEVSGRQSADIGVFTDALTQVRFDSPYTYEQLLLQMMQRSQRTGGVILITSGLTTHIADIAIRMHMNSMRVKLIYIADTPRREVLEMLERIRMSGAIVECVDPGIDGGYTAGREMTLDFE